jgi:EAL domain-containing protein (putative c-di-GMP-specific phosphodiesterase class I)
VLLVEDDRTLLRASARLLTRAGYTIDAVSSGVEALHALLGENFDVMVSDIAMPDMDGIALLAATRERDPSLPVVLVTGTPTVATAAQALEHGALKYLTKPVPVKLLIDTVAEAVAHCRLARAKRKEVLDDIGAEPSSRAALHAAFGRALDSLWVAFQPIVRASDQSLYGYEAFLRSKEPSLPDPRSVLDAAEQLGQLRRLGRAVRETAAGVLAKTSLQCALFINLHPEELLDPELFERSALVPLASRVVLEITERAALDRIENLCRRIAQARTLGFRVAVDDLGAGYGGLSSFPVLEPEVVKLDMSLVRDIHFSKMKQKLVGSMATLCKQMKALLVAEGVETVEERDALVDLGCDLLQGFRFGKPAPTLDSPTW